jgi:DnaJ-class molecular chaperone
MWGLLSKEVPTTCSECGGKGSSVEFEPCPLCEGRGLIGNESEVCRTCNGAGRADAFGFIPRDLLQPGIEFHRRCEKCGNHSFRLRSGIMQQKVVKSWDSMEELRQVEYNDACEVACTECGHKYTIPLGKSWHQRLSPDQYSMLESRGVDLGFLYQTLR